MKTMPQKIKKVIDEFQFELIDMGYSQGVRWTYGKVCRLFGEWADGHAIDCLSEKAIRAYALEKTGCWEAAINLPSKDKITLRALRLLNNFFNGEAFEGRTPLKEHRFYTILKDHVHSYLRWCEEEKGYRPSTIQYKFLILCRYDNFLHDKMLDLENVTIELNEEFFASDACGNRTSYKSTVREMLQYLFDFSILDKDLSPYVLKEPNRSKRLEIPTTYTTKEIKSLLGAIDRSTPKGKRDYLVVLLAAEYGMRASDIVRLSLKHIDWERNTVSFSQYKTDVPVQYPLLSSVGNAIVDYLRHGRPTEVDDVIIVSHDHVTRGKLLSTPTIYSIVTAAFLRSQIQGWQKKKHGPHSLRFSLASNMLKQGIGFQVISTVLGHSSTESTKAYIKIDIDRLRECSLPVPNLNSYWYTVGKEDVK
jgi:site-specific recombinase XerD